MTELTPEEKAKIIEAQEAKIREQREADERSIKKRKIGCFTFLAIIALLVLIYLTVAIIRHLKPERPKLVPTERSYQTYAVRDFKHAQQGETWIILDDNIALLKEPKISSDKTRSEKNLAMRLEKGVTIQVLKTRGNLNQWKYCKVKDQFYGWILAETVKNAVRTQ